MSTLTPMMEQYYRMKKEYPDSILFFRMGDFYEMFSEDAKIGSKVLGIALTSRAKGEGDKIPLCGIPYHALDRYLEKMVDSGFKVAICEQVEDPKKAKGIVRREIVRVVTASTLIRSGTDVKSDNTYLACIYPHKNQYGFVIVDLATGEFRGSSFEGENAKSELRNEVARLEPREILIPTSHGEKDELKEIYSAESVLLVTKRDDWWFTKEQAENTLKEHFAVLSLDGLGFGEKDIVVCAGGGIISYLAETQKSALEHINSLKYYSLSENMVLDPSTLKNLEILKNAVDGSKEGTLLQIIDYAITAMGKRLIRNWL
ncbi:DNA mismatch repair protein MutS, partial [bacterium]|nr:DNA mismatch repair protein MutS [bacterium]